MRLSNKLPYRAVLLLLSTLLLPVMNGGCLVSGDSRATRSGNYISDSTFDQIQPGKTTGGWISATLGKPSSISRIDDGTEIWKYTYSERKESSGAVFLIFGGHNETNADHTAFVEIKNGIVVKAWRMI